MRTKFRRGLILVAFVAGALALPTAQSGEPPVIAIGDIHGADAPFRALLQQTGLTDAADRWVGGRATLVQTGDITDRGAGVRAVMDLLMRLETEADSAGGRVEVLLGNHETMNLMANVRDVTPAIFGSFATDDSVARQEEAYRNYVVYVGQRTAALGRPLPNVASREAWMASHPIGSVEYLGALGQDGSYGRWLRSQPVAVEVDETVFLHGGLAPGQRAASIADLNARAAEEIARFDAMRRHLIDRGVILAESTFPEILVAVALELQAWTVRLFPGPPDPSVPAPVIAPVDRAHLEVLFDVQAVDGWSVIDPDGPVWSRGFARWSDQEGAATAAALLDRFGVERAVVGHTVTPSRRIRPRFGHRVFLIDTGMLAQAYQGAPSALELSAGAVTAVYLDERVRLDGAGP